MTAIRSWLSHSFLVIPYILAVPHIMAVPYILAVPHILAVPRTFPAISLPALRLWIPSYLSSGMEPYTIIRFGTIGYRTDGLFQIANTP